MLNRLEELCQPSSSLDKHTRFLAVDSHAFKNGYLSRPIVDEWINLLKISILRYVLSINLNKTCFSISHHDVDNPSAFVLNKPKRFL